jgi:hypothetical protein
MSMIDQRLWKMDNGGYTRAVLDAAAAAKCDWKTGFDVEDLVARAIASPRPPRGGVSRKAKPIDPVARERL